MTFRTFQRGEIGALSPLRAPEGSYTGRDAVVYASGDIGPRCGVQEITASGGVVGEITGLGYYSLAGGSIPASWFGVGTAVYRNVLSPVALTGALASAPTKMLAAVPIGQTVYASSYGDKLYKWDATTVSAVASSPGGLCACLFGDRLLVANTLGSGGSGAGGLTTNRVFYSAANNFNSWPGTNYFDVGRGASIAGLWAVRNLIYISLDDGTWWIYSGVPGSTDVLRLAYSGASAPEGPGSGAVVGGQSVYFVARGEHFPSWFNGATVNTLDEQNVDGGLYGRPATGRLPGVTVLPVSRSGDFLALAGAALTGSARTSLLFREQKWSRHSVWPPVGVQVPGGDGLVLLCDGGSATAAPRFFYWTATNYERPPDGSGYRATLDASSGPVSATVELPEHVPAGAMTVRVQRVRVDARMFDQAAVPTYLRLPGIAGNYMATPNGVAVALVGDLDLRARVSLDDWTPGVLSTIAACAGAADGYVLRVNAANRLEVVWYDAAAVAHTIQSTVAPTVADNAALWVRAVLDIDNGAAGHTVTFYTATSTVSDHSAVTWTILGTAVVTAGVTTVKASTGQLAVGIRSDGTTDPMIGNLYTFTALNGIAGTAAANAVFSDQPAGTTSFVDKAGLVWTVTTTGALVAQIKTSVSAEQALPRFGFDVAVVATRRGHSSEQVEEIDDTVGRVRHGRCTPANGTATGRANRWVFGAGDQGIGGGFKVRLTNIRGVSIEQVEVDYLETLSAVVP